MGSFGPITSISEWIRAYAGIVGAGLGALINVFAALFIARRVNEGGKINFLFSNAVARLYIRDREKPVVVNSFEQAQDGTLFLSYDLYNNSGVRKVMRAMLCAFRVGRKLENLLSLTDRAIFRVGPRQTATLGATGQRITLPPQQVTIVTLDPKELKALTVEISMTKWSLDHIIRNRSLVFVYKDEKDGKREFHVSKDQRDCWIRYDMKMAATSRVRQATVFLSTEQMGTCPSAAYCSLQSYGSIVGEDEV